MELSQHKVEPFDYSGGADFINRLMKVYSVSHRMDLSNIIGVSPGTMSTWRTRNQTPFEIAVRVHLASGVSLNWLLLGEGEMFEASQPSKTINKVDLPYFELKNGELIDKGKMFFDPQFLEGMPEAEHLMLVVHEGQKLFVDKSKTKAISGQYLINIDGDVSLNSMQKLPGNMVAIEFSQSTVQLDEGDIEVLGKVL